MAERLSDPGYRAFLIALYRLPLASDEDLESDPRDTGRADYVDAIPQLHSRTADGCAFTCQMISTIHPERRRPLP